MRLLLACLVMLAIPLQGFAAATMLFCGAGNGHHAAAAPTGAQHDHRGHVHPVSDAHASHTEVQAKMAPDFPDATAKTPAGTVHKCGVCSSCCHLVAITESVPLVRIALVPHADIAAPVVAVQNRPVRVPDKPPRA